MSKEGIIETAPPTPSVKQVGSAALFAFVVVAFRYGVNENVFPIGVFQNRYSAEVAAKEHRNYRGVKYSHRIYPFRSIGKWDDDVGHSVNSKPCIEANAESNSADLSA